MIVYKDGASVDVREGAQLDAFLRSGWTAERPAKRLANKKPAEPEPAELAEAEPQDEGEADKTEQPVKKAPARRKPQAK